MNSNFLPSILPAVLLAIATTAQTPPMQTVNAISSPTTGAPQQLPWAERVLTDVDADGTTWAGAPSWKAAFTAHGVAFHPYVGAERTGVQATFTLRSVRCADRELPLTRGTPSHRGLCITYDRGTVRECYDLRLDGIEQRFVFDALPSRGELRLAVGVNTTLNVIADAEGHALRSGDVGVHYGQATAIDGNGRTCAMPVQFVDGAFQLVVPADFVASAALPLVVDPLIGNASTQVTSPKELLSTDMAYDQSLDQFFVSYERAYSATDHDVYVAYCDDNMVPQGVVTIDLTTQNWVRPRIATLEAHDTACVVAQTSTGTVAPFTIKGRILLGGAPPLVQPVIAISSNSYDNFEPDVGGDARATGPSRFLVVWESRSPQLTNDYLTYQTLDALGTMLTSSAIASQSGIQQRVAVSKTCGAAGGNSEGWAMLYRYSGFQQTIGELRFATVSRAGSLRILANGTNWASVTSVTPNAGSEWEVSSPTTHDLGRGYLCVDTRVNQATGNGGIHGTVVDWHGNVLVPDTVVVSDTYDYGLPTVACDDYHFLLGYLSYWTATDHAVRVLQYSRLGNALVMGTQALVSSGTNLDAAPTVCALPGQLGQYALGWVRNTAASSSVLTQRFDGPAQGIIASRPTGCAPGGSSSTVVGRATIGDSFTVSFNFPSGLAAILAGTPTSQPIGPCPGCTLGVDGTLYVGNALPVAVPLNAALVGVTVSFQGVQIDVVPANCLGVFRVTGTWDITIV